MINKIIDYIMKEAFVAKWAELYQNQLDNMVNQFAAKNKSKLQQNPNDDINELKKPYFEYAKLLNDNVIKKIKVDSKTEKLLVIWLLEQILNGTIEGERLHEDVELIKDNLEKYFKNRDLIGKNIFTPGITYHSLQDMVEPYRVISEDKYEGLLDKPVAQGNGYKIYELITMDQCIPIGDKGGWCINKTSYANDYLKQGDLYFVTKNDKQFGLLHFPTGQFKYIQNRDMSLEDIIRIRDMWPESERIAKKNILLKAENIIWIKNPSEALLLAAVKQDGQAIEYIKNPSETVINEAFKTYVGALKYMKNPSEAVQLAAVKRNGYAIEHIENPSEALQLAAVERNGAAIRYIKNPSEAVQFAAVKLNGNAIKYIENPSEALQLEAVKQNGWAIQYIENPSEAVQLAAVKQDGYSIIHIKNPTKRVKQYVKEQYGK
jgi:hypothetical protein